MSLFGRLGDIARNIGDKASGAIETSKLNSRIDAEKSAIAESMRRIGEFYYQRHQAGGVHEPEIAEIFAAIDGHNATIAEIQAEIVRMQEESAAQASAAQAAQVLAQPSIPVAPPAPAGVICPICGASNAPGTKFCGTCGAKLEVPEVAPVAEERICPDCGAKIPAESKFCGECGHRFL